MFETYLPAFETLVKDAKVEAVMGAYNRVEGEPACAQKFLMQDILRGEWGFEGHFVSDCWAIADFHQSHKVTDTAPESAALALKNGCDVNCGNTYLALMQAYQEGRVTEDEITTACVRLFTCRYLLGLFDEKNAYNAIPYAMNDCDRHAAKALEAAHRSMVLLKNDGILPLPLEKLRSVAVIGPNADSIPALEGNYSGTSSRYVTYLQGIRAACAEAGVRVNYALGSHLYKKGTSGLAMPDDRLAEAAQAAEMSDVAIVVVGLDPTIEGEEGDASNEYSSGDKKDLLLPLSQRKLLDAVLAVGKPTTIVLMAGSAIDLGEAADKADAVLLAWYPGARGGKTVADILFGKVSPSGKLPVTFYHNSQLDEMPAFTDYAMKGRTYRYFGSEPIYPFGYGLTYGDVSVTAASAASEANGIIVSAELTNHGTTDTEDVLQIYAQNEGSVNAPLNPRLVGFARVMIPAGKTISAAVTISNDRLLVINDDGQAVAEGSIVLYAGVGQPDSRTQALTGHTAVKINL